MKFTKVIGRKELIQAAIFGSIAGAIGVVLFVLILNSMNTVEVQESTEQAHESQEETIPVQSTETTPSNNLFDKQFYANQYGVFSTFDGATEFMADYPSLNASAIVKVDDTYYVWSEISPEKTSISKSEDPPSFIKTFTFSGGACTNQSIQNIPILLSNEDETKFSFEGAEKPENLPDDWQTITAAMTSLSSDLDVTRVHLLKHYFELNDCLKIQF